MHPLNRKIFRDLKRLRGQAFAIAMIVASGIGVLVMSLSAMQALTDTTQAYYERYQFADVFAVTKRTPMHVVRELEGIDGVRTIEPRIVQYATIDVESFPEPIAGSFVSIPENHPPRLNQLALRAGRMPLDTEPDEILINEPFAEAHALAPGDTIEALLNGRKRVLNIVGLALSPEFVYAIGPGTLMPDAARYGVVWMGQKALAAAYDLDHAFNNAAFSLWPGSPIASVLRSIDDILEKYGGIGAIARDDQISNWFVMNEIEQLKSIASIMPPIFLAVAAFLTNMVLARLVYIERAEIGLLKAFGYTDVTMAWHYIKFVLIICAAGVIIGWGLGYWLGHWMTTMYADLFRFPLLVFAPRYDIYVLSATISIGAALIGAIGAVRFAASLPPAEAMRPPSPPAFRHHSSLLAGLVEHLDQPTRIIFRQVFRRPLRTLLTSLGVSASVAVLVASLQWLDAIDYMIEDYFTNQQRQDITISLVEAANTDVVNDLARLPGIQAVEPHRAVAARLHSGPRYRREAVIGLPQNGELEVLHDVHGSRVPLPGNGLLVSSAMADILGAGVGDAVIVEVLEGRRPIVAIEVAAIFETLIGTPVYMEFEALNRTLNEPERTNLLVAVFDERQQQHLYETIKELPTVAGVVLKRAAIDLFDQTIGETMLIMIFFYVAFASTLAFGVLYNNMRISLSERGRELATLRVLGFTNAEIAYMLFGEAAVLTLIGLPLGCLLGWLLAVFMAQGFNTELFRIPVVIEASTYGYSMLVVLTSAFASALLVERRLVRLNLISVLKTRE
jgi:putative ABC transport system permease protein